MIIYFKEIKHKIISFQIYNYAWVQGAAPPNSTKREGACVRSTVHLSKAVSPAFELREFTSKNYSTWTESRWKSIKGRIFLVASHDLEVSNRSLQPKPPEDDTVLRISYTVTSHYSNNLVQGGNNRPFK